MKTILVLSLVMLSLFGCSSNKERDSWNSYVSNQTSMNKQGHIKDSEMYENLYYEIQTKKLPDHRFLSLFMERYSTMIDAALAYESGKISISEYNTINRRSETKFITKRDNLDSQISQNKSQALFNIGQQLERMGTPIMYNKENECRYNPATGRYQICISPSVRGCAGYGAGC